MVHFRSSVRVCMGPFSDGYGLMAKPYNHAAGDNKAGTVGKHLAHTFYL